MLCMQDRGAVSSMHICVQVVLSVHIDDVEETKMHLFEFEQLCPSVFLSVLVMFSSFGVFVFGLCPAFPGLVWLYLCHRLQVDWQLLVRYGG